MERWQGCTCWMNISVLCLHAAGGGFADLRFLAPEDVLGSPCHDTATGNTAGAVKCQSRRFTCRQQELRDSLWGSVLGTFRDLLTQTRLWVSITGLLVWILYGILAAYLGSNALILFAWILRRFRCGAFHMNGGWVLPLFGPWKGWFSVRGGFIPELSDEGHGWASNLWSPQEEEVEVSEGSGAETKWNKKQSCKGLNVSLLLWLREGGQQEALLIPPPTPTQKEKGVHVCWRGHHRWLLHHRVCVPGSPGGKRWPMTPPDMSRSILARLFLVFCFFLAVVVWTCPHRSFPTKVSTN